MTRHALSISTIIHRLAIDDEGRSCADIPESSCYDEPHNFSRHVASLSATKFADALINPKLVLSWLMTQLGAGSGMVGLLVPIREAGALLPQLFTAGWLRQIPQRKWAWSLGSLIQGIMAFTIVAIALYAPNEFASWLILLALTALALARSVCSVCYKDVLGKTVSKSQRGTATGLASSIAGAATIGFAVLLILGLVDRFTLVIGAISAAGIMWVIAAYLFTTLAEAPGATEGGRSAFKDAISNLSYLQTDPQLRLFIGVRALLTATALAPPFIVAAGSGEGADLVDTLGFFVLASALASLCSGFVWGRLADRSSRKVLIITGFAGAIILAFSTVFVATEFLRSRFILPSSLFVLMLAYEGVRLGRSTHLVDMGDEQTRAAYTALSNTIIGVLLIAGAGFALIGELFGTPTVLGFMTLMCLAAAILATRLEEVQKL